MVLDAQNLSVAQFDEWALRSDNISHSYEFIAGEVYEVVSNSISSNLGSIIGGFLAVYVHTNDLGHTTGADGGYQVGDDRYIPDVGFISKKRMPEFEDTSYISMPPDLAVEVVSPTDSQRLITIKVANYLAEGTIVWVVYPEEQAIDVYAPNTAVIKLTIDGGDLLPDFQLALKTIFK